jgi:hypothetical protein
MSNAGSGPRPASRGAGTKKPGSAAQAIRRHIHRRRRPVGRPETARLVGIGGRAPRFHDGAEVQSLKSAVDAMLLASAFSPVTERSRWSAAIAQLVEHVIRNDGVTGSNPACGTIRLEFRVLKKG